MVVVVQVIAHEDYGTSADVYSYGIVLYEILTRELPFHGISPMTVFHTLTANAHTTEELTLAPCLRQICVEVSKQASGKTCALFTDVV